MRGLSPLLRPGSHLAQPANHFDCRGRARDTNQTTTVHPLRAAGRPGGRWLPAHHVLEGRDVRCPRARTGPPRAARRTTARATQDCSERLSGRHIRFRCERCRHCWRCPDLAARTAPTTRSTAPPGPAPAKASSSRLSPRPTLCSSVEHRPAPCFQFCGQRLSASGPTRRPGSMTGTRQPFGERRVHPQAACRDAGCRRRGACDGGSNRCWRCPVGRVTALPPSGGGCAGRHGSGPSAPAADGHLTSG